MGQHKGKKISNDEFNSLLIQELQNPNSNAHLKTTFYNYLKLSHSIDKNRALKLHDRYYSEYITAKNNKLKNESIGAEKEVAKELILSKIDRLRIAEEIAVGKAKKMITENGTKIVMPTFGERLKALEYLSKIQGDFVASQLEISGKGGADLLPKKFKVNIIKANKQDE